MSDKAQLSGAVVGCTGLVGGHILSTFLSLPSSPPTHAIARSALPTEYPNLHPKISADTTKWTEYVSALSPPPSILFSALGTSRRQAGSVDAQRQVDVELNLALARQARAAGVETYVLISSAGVSEGSMIPYFRMKAELERLAREIGFKHTVLVKPGFLVGERNRNPQMGERMVRGLATGLGSVGMKDFWAQDAEVVARAAVSAGLQCARGERPEGVWLVEQSDVIRLGRTEWKEGK